MNYYTFKANSALGEFIVTIEAENKTDARKDAITAAFAVLGRNTRVSADCGLSFGPDPLVDFTHKGIDWAWFQRIA